MLMPENLGVDAWTTILTRTSEVLEALSQHVRYSPSSINMPLQFDLAAEASLD